MREKGAVDISTATELKQHFDQLVRHDYLQQYIDDTRPDQDELWLAYQLIREVEPGERALAISLAWGFVHAGVMIHDLVSLHNEDDDRLKKRRQLNVLAGDFYSARYYQSLAGVNAVDMVELFGSTLQEIYELKMAHYMDKSLTAKAFYDQKAAVDALLLLRIIQKEADETFAKRLETFFLTKRVKRQLRTTVDEEETNVLRTMLVRAEQSLQPLLNSQRNDILDQFFCGRLTT
ncbi:heptaprenyl diphosphate synthase component 1 [Shouchella miscanthi]|uniref:heptaprenyl diphosphate synthase component 1 n=1 Tax=Shouchella miscanthi TaxID=2598861 RepID=UPI0011A664A6|nr:heptaprenyl diphosphate synthase component 1 [Shouchella miscanthi]